MKAKELGCALNVLTVGGFVVFIILAALRLFGAIDWAWWWVCCPLIAPMIITIVTIVYAMLLMRNE